MNSLSPRCVMHRGLFCLAIAKLLFSTQARSIASRNHILEHVALHIPHGRGEAIANPKQGGVVVERVKLSHPAKFIHITH